MKRLNRILTIIIVVFMISVILIDSSKIDASTISSRVEPVKVAVFLISYR